MTITFHITTFKQFSDHKNQKRIIPDPTNYWTYLGSAIFATKLVQGQKTDKKVVLETLFLKFTLFILLGNKNSWFMSVFIKDIREQTICTERGAHGGQPTFSSRRHFTVQMKRFGQPQWRSLKNSSKFILLFTAWQFFKSFTLIFGLGCDSRSTS